MELNRIYNMDCLEGMKEILDNSVDMILTDPPYGIDYQSQRKKDKSEWMPKIINDKKPFTGFIEESARILKDDGCMMVFTRWDVQQEFVEEIKKNKLDIKNVIIWDKQIHGMGDLKRAYGSKYESIIFANKKRFRFPNKRPTDIISCQRVLPNKLKHPNEKPVMLIETLIRQCTGDDAVIIDAFMGSGTTAIACINTNRNYIGFELDEDYFNIAEERIKNARESKG